MNSAAGVILVVDDNESNRDLLCRQLARKRYDAVSAENGEQALEWIAKQAFDLILLDIMMPGIGGMEVLKSIRHTHTRTQLPIIMVTACDHTQDIVEAFHLGANDYITKPLDFPVLFVRIQTQISLKKAEEALKEAKNNLEMRVAERTAELKTTNEHLRQEMSQRAQAEEALREHEERLQSLVEHQPDGVCLLDATQQVVLANPLAADFLTLLTDWPKDSTISRIADFSIEKFLTLREDGLSHEVAIDSPQRRIFKIQASPVRKGTAKRGWVMTFEDITREREIQERIQQQDRLAAVGQLAAGIAHDFNNMLTVMMGVTQMMEMRSDISMPLKEDLRTIFVQGQRAAQLIRQILDFSHKNLTDQEAVNIAPLLKESIKLLERTFPANIKISMDLTGEKYVVNANLGQLQQVFTNLAVNARDAMPYGGELRVRLDYYKKPPDQPPPLPGMVDQDWIVWTVADSGQGMPPEVLEHIFEPFFTTKNRNAGTGLGLAQVYGIIKQYGGEIDVTSQVGTGTTFIIYLPESAEEEGVQNPPVKDVHQGHGDIILLVEDQKDVQCVAKRMLESLNYRILLASNGQEALDIYAKHRDDIVLVLTDIMMPQMDGLALFKNLQGLNPDIKVVMMTGYSTIEGGGFQPPKEIAGFLEKPLIMDHVADVIERVLEKN